MALNVATIGIEGAYVRMGSLRRRKAIQQVSALVVTTILIGIQPASADPAPTPTQTLSNLVGDLTGTRAEIAQLQLNVGNLQEAVNKALVDYHDAQSSLAHARKAVQDARKALQETQAKLSAAQKQLDEISRVTYRLGESISQSGNYSGSKSSKDSLDRLTYLRAAAEKQQEKINQLERLRTEQANEEARLRKIEQFEQSQTTEAEQTHQEAQDKIEQNSAELEQKNQQLQKLQEEESAKQTDLNSARSQDSADAKTQGSSATTTAPAVPSEKPGEAAPSEVTGTEKDANGKSATTESNAAADLIASTQPDHGLLDSLGKNDSSEESKDANGTDDATTPALQNDERGNEINSTLADLDVVKLDTTESVTQKASELVTGDKSQQIETVIARAQSQIGVPYVWGGGDANGPTSGVRDGGTGDANGDYKKVGFDCSGLMIYAFAGVGIALPHYTGYQYQKGTKVSPKEMKRGDLIFYGPNADTHVALYLGDGQMIEAPYTGATVRVTPVRWSGMTEYAVRLL